MKRRWKQTAGFTLVELIVVIAILGILAGVAVPTYSGYMKKANMAADETLVNDVKTALTLQHYSQMNDHSGGYVVLTPEGSSADAVGGAAMAATFGDNWEDSVFLKYDGWGTNELLDVVAGYTPEEAARIKNATFLQAGSPEGIMNATTNLLDIAAKRIFASNHVSEHVANLGGTLGTDLSELELDPDSEEYSTAVANLLVGHFADAMTPGSSMEGSTASISNLITFYSQVYAFCAVNNDFTLLNAFNDELNGASYSTISGNSNRDDFMDALEGSADNAVRTQYGKFVAHMQNHPDSRANDEAALKDVMKAVSVVANGYKDDATALTNKTLYSEPDVVNQVNNFVNAVKAKAEGKMPDTIPDGSVLVMLYEDGTTSSTLNSDE